MLSTLPQYKSLQSNDKDKLKPIKGPNTLNCRLQ